MNVFFSLCAKAVALWFAKGSDALSAMVSYYMLFALVPLLLLMVIFSSIFYDRDFVVQTLDAWGSVLGADVLTLLHNAVNNLEAVSYGYGVPLLVVLFFSWAVITMLNTFTTGLHTLWDIEHTGIRGWFHRTLRSVLFVLLFEVYLFILIGAGFFATRVIEHTGLFGLLVIEPLFFVVVTTLLFGMAYGILPRRAPTLTHRLQGGFVASVLLLLAKTLVAFYMTKALVPSLFGAAGLILVILIWVYVSVAIIYFGAAFAKVVQTYGRAPVHEK